MKDEKKFNLTRKLIYYAFPLLFIAGILIPYLMNLNSYIIFSLFITIPLMIVFIIYHYQKNQQIITWNIKNRILKTLDYSYYALYIISILILLYTNVRPITYYLIISILFGIIFIKISFSKEITNNGRVILAQIISLFLNISYGITLKYDFFIGRTDPIVHTWFIQNVIQSGKITDALALYENFPLWHIFISMISLATRLPFETNKIMYLTSGVIFSSIIIIIFYISNSLFKNIRIALLTSLLLSFFSNFIVNTISALPRMVNGALGVAVLYLLIKEQKPWDKVLATLASLSMIMVHSASMVSITLVIIAIWTSQYLYKIKENEKIITNKFLVLLGVAITSYWVYYVGEVVTKAYFSLSFQGMGNAIGTAAQLPINEVFNYLQNSPFILFTALGLLFLLPSHHSDRSKILGLLGLGVLALSIPNPLFLNETVFTRLSINRFGEYSYALIILMAGFGLYSFTEFSKKPIKIVIIGLIIISCFLSISNDFTASDNPILKRTSYTYYLNQEELTGIQTVYKLSNESLIFSDYITVRYFWSSIYSDRGYVIEIDRTSGEFLRQSSGDLFLVRESELSKRPLNLLAVDAFRFNPSWSLRPYFKENPVWSSLNNFNRVYDDQVITSYN